MKKLTTLCLAACLAAAMATPAGALDYAIDAPEGPDFGKFTSVEVVHTAHQWRNLKHPPGWP